MPLMRDHGVLDEASAQAYAPAPRLTVTGPQGEVRTLNDFIRNLTEPQRTCECILWEYSAEAGRMVAIDAQTVVLEAGQ